MKGRTGQERLGRVDATRQQNTGHRHEGEYPAARMVTVWDTPFSGMVFITDTTLPTSFTNQLFDSIRVFSLRIVPLPDEVTNKAFTVPDLVFRSSKPTTLLVSVRSISRLGWVTLVRDVHT